MFTLKVTCVACRFEDGKPDADKHERMTRGKRNVPALLPDGKPAVLPDGTPDVKTVEFQHVFFQPPDCPPFHVEMPLDQAAKFAIGKEYVLTVG